jgi:hypothetical protein
MSQDAGEKDIACSDGEPAEPHRDDTARFTSSAPLASRGHATPDADPKTEQNDERLQDSQSHLNDDEDTNDEDEPASDPADPQEPIERFPWENLMARYHEKMHDLQSQEDQILQEFNGLCDVQICRTLARKKCLTGE